MAKLRIHCLSTSADGYAAGPEQSGHHPLGRGGMALHQWFFRTFSKGTNSPATEKVDSSYVAQASVNIGATILGRNMFGPIRGPWQDENWKGWWGDDPPYVGPVYVLTHHARPSFQIGKATFHFVTVGIEAALAQAIHAANGRDVLLGGGVSVIRQYLKAQLVDYMHVVLTPVLLGRGEPLLRDLDLLALGYRVVESRAGSKTLHLVVERQPETARSRHQQGGDHALATSRRREGVAAKAIARALAAHNRASGDSGHRNDAPEDIFTLSAPE